MSNMHRIQWFDQQIRDGNFPSSRRLAEQFEISRRQAQRDIEYLEISLRAPLIYVAKNRGYGYEDKTYVLPHLYMTEEEKVILKYLARKYGQYDYDNAGAVQRVAHLLRRFTDEEGPDVFSHLPIFEADPRFIQYTELLSLAVREQLVVYIHYKSQDEESHLHIHPLRLMFRYNADYIVAYCEDGAQDMERLFRIDCIQNMSVTSTKFDKAFAGTIHSDSPLRLRKPFTATMEFYEPLEGSSWNGYPARSIGDLMYEVDFYDMDSFVQHLLVVTEWRQLKSPQWLRHKLQSRCSHVLVQLNQE